MTESRLSPDEQRALAAICRDRSIARFMAPNFMRHLESLGLIERLNSGIVVSDEGRRQAEVFQKAYSF
jgi:ribosomal protein S19E (S16A)